MSLPKIDDEEGWDQLLRPLLAVQASRILNENPVPKPTQNCPSIPKFRRVIIEEIERWTEAEQMHIADCDYCKKMELSSQRVRDEEDEE